MRNIVVGKVVTIRRSRYGWRVRLTDTGGALAAAEIVAATAVTLPRRGARVVIRGRVRYDDVHQWYTVDPVEEWGEIDAR